MNTTMTTHYETKDFYLTGYLVASGMNLISNQRYNNTTTFVFEKTSRLDVLVTAYYGLQGNINPVTYANALRNLKSIIHSNINTTGTQYVKQLQSQQ